MRGLLIVLVVAAATFGLPACGGGSSPGPGPSGGCRTGCPCGRSCISCEYTCRMADPESDGPMPAAPDPGSQTLLDAGADGGP